MKKIIICILLLIPIIVILTLNASGKLIASALVDIQAENIVLKHEGESLITDEVYLEDYKNSTHKYTIFAEVYPGIATTELVWSTSNAEVATVSKGERKNSCEVTFLDYGSVDITCTSAANDAINARTTIYVSGNTPGYMTIMDYGGSDTENALSLKRYDSKSLFASVKPARSVKGTKVNWTSNNPSVATVDANGIITAVGEGDAVITASVTAHGITVSDTLNVTVSGEALLKTKTIYVASNVNINEYLTNAGASSGYLDNVVTIDDLAVGQSKEVQVTYAGDSEVLNVVRVSGAPALIINNLAELKAGVLSTYLALGTSNVSLSASAILGTTPTNITWTTSDSNVIQFKSGQGGRIYAVGSGSAVVTAQAAGYESASITINVTSAVDDFRLSESSYDDKVGLKRERVFGNLTYVNGNYVNQYTLRIKSTSPSGVGLDAFTFESSNPSIATVNSQGVITFVDDVEGLSVTISATAYNAEGTAVRQSYTFKMVNGVNIGVNSDNSSFDRNSKTLPDFTPYNELKVVAFANEAKAVVLHCDIYYPSKTSGGTSIINMMIPLYGNGKKVDGQFFMTNVDDTDKLFLWDFEQPYLARNSHDVKFENVNLQSTQPTSEDSLEAFTEMVDHGGGAIGVKNKYQDGQVVTFKFDHCLFQYAYSHTDFANGDVLIDGCIFRNNSATAVVIQQTTYGKTNVTIKNCIFSNTIAPVGMVCGAFNDVIDTLAKKQTGTPQWGSFNVEGQNYIYNWKKLDDIQMNLLPKVHDVENADTMNGLIGSFNGVLSDVIKEAFLVSKKDHLYVDSNGEQWLNFSFLILGIWQNINPYFNPKTQPTDGVAVNFSPTSYAYYEVNAYRAPTVSSVAGLAKKLGVDVKTNKTYLLHCKNQEGEWNTKPGDTYTIGDKVYARLDGTTNAN